MTHPTRRLKDRSVFSQSTRDFLRLFALPGVAWILAYLLAFGTVSNDLASAHGAKAPSNSAIINGVRIPSGEYGGFNRLAATTGLRSTRAGLAFQAAPNSPSNVSTITSNFNGTSIPAGDYIWFNSVMKPSGIPSTGATITVSGAKVQFTANGLGYSLPVPDSVITFSSSATTSTTLFDAAHNQWQTIVPTSYSGNVMLAGLSDYLSLALPGGINPVSWTATFYCDKTGVSLQWQWAAAVYTTFSASYGSLGVKPIDATSGSAYTNSDHAGTPENYKSYVVGGARGGGGSNWTGSYSGTASVTPQVTSNHAPVANAGPSQTVFVGTTVQLDGTASTDPDGLRITYSWSFVSVPTGSTASLGSPAGPTPTFVVDKSGNYTVQLVVSDGELTSAPSQVVISTKNSPPVANAGPNQTVPTKTTVQLNGSGSSDVDGNPLTYRWTIVSAPQGSTATLTNPTTVNSTFVTDLKGTFVIQLIVNDGTVDSSPSQVTISDVNSPPVANAGPDQTLITGKTVQLDGSGSTDVDGDHLTYSWAILSAPSGSTATVSNATIVNPTFFADKTGTYIVQLVVNDGIVNSQPTTVTITSQNVPPVANAGPNQTVPTQSTVQLDGSKSTDANGDSLTYQWSLVTLPPNSHSALSNPTIVNPTFVTDQKGTYVAQLIVNDGALNSTPSQVTTSDVNSPPVANAGPNQTTTVGANVQLDGSHSTDVDGDTLTYTWSLLSVPAGSNATLSSATAVQPTLVADRVGTYVAQLIVNDGTVDSNPATVTISTGDVPPVANPGTGQTVSVGATVTLNGSASTDSDGLPLIYQWSLLSTPQGSPATLSSTSTVTTQFVADLPGDYVAQLVVNDGYLNSTASTVTVSTNDVPPIANPGPSQTVLAGTTVQLDGTGSTASINHALTYRWAILSQPTDGTAALSSITAAKPTLVPNVAGLYVVQLIVNDGFLDSQPATTTVTASPQFQPPTVSAGPNQTIELPINTATLNGSAVSTAPAGAAVTVQWTQVSGPGTVAFASPTEAVTQATFPVVGNYVLQLTGIVTVSGLSSSSQTSIIVAPVNQPPAVSVGPDQTILYPTSTAVLNGTATDDGLPVGSALHVSWSKVFGPGNVTFSNPTQPNTQAVFSATGTYGLQLSASDGQFTSSAIMRVSYLATSGGSISVSAGSDQVIVFPNAATLNGVVVDSNSTPPSPLSSHWSQVSGPGATTFNNPNLPATTANFNVSGVYVLRLTATDGMFTATSDVKIYAGNLQCTLSNKGTDFWSMFPGALYQTPSTTPPRQISLFITSDAATGGTVTIPGQGFTQQFTTVPGQVTTINLAQSAQTFSSDTVEAKGIHVTAQNPVAVYGLNFVPFATDGYLGLPTNTLGTSYIVGSYANTGGPYGAAYGTEFGIVASQDNTTVTIVPTSSSGNHQSRVPYTLQLDQGQTYQLSNPTDPSQLGLPVDFTGTVVTSSKPVAVFGAHNCTFVPNGSGYCNHLVEQMPPTNIWGQNFVTMPLSQDPNGDTFRFVAQTNGTHVQVNHQEVAVLQAGQFYEQLVIGPAEISGDQPILVLQYHESSTFSGTTSDPTMLVVPPFEHFGGNFTVETPTANFPDNYINIIAPTAAAQSGGVTLDGNVIPASGFATIGTSPFSGAEIHVPTGAHSVTGTLPIGGSAYGFNNTDAYGYDGGVCLAKGVVGTSVLASPKTNTNQITSNTCVQAKVTDPSGNPVGGAGVSFSVAGVNPQNGFASTDTNGIANFCYTGFNNGSDIITATSNGSSDTAGATWVSNGPNQAPLVNAGANQSISLPASTVLNGSVVDDGLPIGGSLTSSWTQLSGPAAAAFGTPNQAQTSVAFPQPGVYVFQLTGNDTQLSKSAATTVTVYAPNKPPVVSAGVDQTFLWVFAGYGYYQSVPLSGSASDDGLPSGSALTTNWSVLSGPGTVAFADPTSTSTVASFSAPGVYLLQLSANDTQFTSTSTMRINAAGPVAFSQSVPSVAVAGVPVTLTANVTVGGQAPAAPFAVQWVSLPAGAQFDSPNALTTNVTFPGQGGFNIRAVVYDTQIGMSDAYTSQFQPVNVGPAGTTVPATSIAAPLDGAQITSPTTVLGSVSDGNWTLSYALQDDFNPLQFRTFASGSGTVTNAALGTLDPTLMLNGTYVLRLTSTNSYGLFSSATVTFSVARNMKLGVFSLAFNDITIPVAGIPIQVIRSYDSRDKGLGDFGTGWRLGLSNIRLQKNHNLGLNWQETQTQSGYLPQFCINATDNKIVTVTFPDGRVFTFQPNAGGCQLSGDISAATLGFTQEPGPASTAGATLVPADGGQFVVEGSAPGPVRFFGYDGNAYNPTTFILTTNDGTHYTIDQKVGLTSVTDTNSNTLTVSPQGISSSSGKSVVFARDEQGKITRITDANGNATQYSYGGSDLVNVSDRDRNQTQLTYDTNHNLKSIVGPAGQNLLSNTYDSSGRLTQTADGNGKSTSFTPNLAAQTETIKDRNGNSTTYSYDGDGNVTQVVDALGNTTTYTYDGNDNKLSETNALGKTTSYTYDGNGNRLTETDPLQHTTTYTYNQLNRPLTITDANGHATTNTYDPNGNLLTTTDPMNGTTTNTYGANGLLATTKDALNKVTRFGYDGYGNLASQTDANGTVTTYGYDNNGNRTSQSVKRTLPDGTQQTLLTQYAYDGNNKLIKTTYPDGSTSQAAYNSLGQQSSTTDSRGNVTSYGYDADGRVTYVGHPDGTSDQTVYDANGNRTRTLTSVSVNGSSGVTTYFHYDALNRLTQTLDQGQTTVLAASGYDAIGQVLTSTDGDGNVTTYTYDDAGRRTSVKDALQHTTTFAYDAAGNQTSVTDANNHTTLYEYDANNRRTKVTYSDLKFESTGYDPLGRVISRTDANGKTTQYGYDALGRLTSVTDALHQTTSYTYDEVGNRLTQTDANQHATTYAYDQRGRRIQRKLPLGQSESYTYDAAGNVATRTDFNGRTTTYTYDAVNHILSKTADTYFATNHIGSAQVTYTYDVHGRRGGMTDATGGTSWSYDDRGRVNGVGGPAGGFGYSYDKAGNLTSQGYNNTNYTYDALNRLSTISTQVGGNRPTVATYGYDNVGNLQSVTYGNGVVHTYGYDNRNRLANLGVAKGSNNLFSYGYTVDSAGHRTSVTEQSGRTVNYGYDDLYRLTSETIANDPNGMNGSVSYSYDPVGNRTQKVSTLPGYPGGLINYNANDQLSTDTYDSNGNTTQSQGKGYVYDFENHLISANGLTYAYDGDGHRVSKTANGTTITFATSDINPTGYSQVLQESYSPTGPNKESQHTYIYGLEGVLELRSHYDGSGNNLTQQMYFVHDGHGSVRAITDQNGAVTDTYDYDAFGVLTHSTGSTLNTTLFSGEQYDPDLGLYFNRARYLNVSTGRFINMDSFEGDSESPASIHKYLYSGANPIDNVDRSGHDFDLASTLVATTGGTTIFGLSTVQSAIVINGVLGGLLASSTAGIGAYLEGKNPEQIEDATGNLYNIALGSLIGIAGGFAGAYRIGRFVLAVVAIGGGGYQAQKEYKTGHTGAAFYYATLGLLAAGLATMAPALAKNAAFLGAPDSPPVGPGASPTDEIVLFRGVAKGHPGYENALQGIANPRGGPQSALGHITGFTDSPFTSWTSDPSVAARFAGDDGVVISRAFRLSDVLQSSSVPGFPGTDDLLSEYEYLIQGSVSDAIVVKK